MKTIYQVLLSKEDGKVWLKKVVNHVSYIHCTDRDLVSLAADIAPEAMKATEAVDAIRDELLSHADAMDWVPGDIFRAELVCHVEVDRP